MKLVSRPATAPLRGHPRVPGDKSISHRALIMATLATGRSRIRGLLQGEDVLATRAACAALGARFDGPVDDFTVEGAGAGGLRAPEGPLDMGNSGTAMRLLAGVLAAQPFDSVLTGDASLNARPMRRIIEPLTAMGAHIEGTPAGTAPLRIQGNPALEGRAFRLEVASAQVKSCLLLAGLFARGTTSVDEPARTRDHTERMLPAFGVTLAGERAVTGPARLTGAEIVVPADPSSAAFLLAAAAMVPGSEVTVDGVGLNPGRTGILRCLEAMGADIRVEERGRTGLEPVGTVRVTGGARLAGIDVPEAWVPDMIDEMPVLMALAARAEGTTRIRGAGELRVKESDRIAVMAEGLGRLGVAHREYEDGIDIEGGAVDGGTVRSHMDHRCAMSFAVLGLAARDEVRVEGAEYIDTSFPGFADLLRALGAPLAEEAA